MIFRLWLAGLLPELVVEPGKTVPVIIILSWPGELALNDVQRHSLARELDRVGVA